MNIERVALSKMGGPLTTPTAPQMTDVNPNKCGEPMKPLGGTLALQGGEEVSSLTISFWKNIDDYVLLLETREWGRGDLNPGPRGPKPRILPS
jgi:hypothetical protein